MPVNPLHFILAALTILPSVIVASHPAGEVAVSDRTTEYKEVVCLFENSVITYSRRPQMRTAEYVLWRTNDEVRRQNMEKTDVTYWKRNADGSVSYHMLLPAHERVIDYNEGDLKVLQRLQTWDEVATFGDIRALLSQLSHDGSVEVRGLGRSAERYVGQINGVDMEIHWLPEEQVPALFRRGFHAELVTMRLVEMLDPSDSRWEPLSDAHYDRYDYADVGDNEDDPVFGFLHHAHDGHAH